MLTRGLTVYVIYTFVRPYVGEGLVYFIHSFISFIHYFIHSLIISFHFICFSNFLNIFPGFLVLVALTFHVNLFLSRISNCQIIVVVLPVH